MTSVLQDRLSRLRKTSIPSVRRPQVPEEDSTTESDAELKAGLRQMRIQRLRSLIDGVIRRQSDRLKADGKVLEPKLPLQAPADPPLWWRDATDSADLPGAVEGAAEDALRVVRTELPPGSHHGAFRVDGALQASPDTLVQLALDAGLGQADSRRALYLDTETTGLSRGAGTVPFLIGLAWFESETLVVEQLFLDELGREEPMLRRLHERVRASSLVVTFNGKAYDWPVLVQRCVLHRLPPPPDRPHLDLLHCARRVYGRRLEQTRLCDLEDAVLGFRRERDVDGCEIPSLYWSFLRNRHPMPMLGVLEHNLHDVVSMSTLLHLLCVRFETLDQAEAPQDQFERARLAVRSKQWEKAEAFARAAVDGGADADTHHLACRLLADLCRRDRRWEASASWLREALQVARSAPDRADVHLALAKLYEHRLKRFDEALQYARAAEGAEPTYDWSRRVDRLEAKIAKQGGAIRPAACRAWAPASATGTLADPSHSGAGARMALVSGSA